MVEPLDKNLNLKKSNLFTAKSRVVPGSAEELTPLLPTICQRSEAVLKGLDLVLEHHGAPKEIREDLSNQMHSYLDDSDNEEVWLSRAKDALTYFLAKYLKNPLPPCPDKRWNPKGSLRRWLKARCNAFNRKNTHFWYSWYQSKRSTLPLSEDFVQKSYDKHLKDLTKADPGCPKLIREIMNNHVFERVLDEISLKLKASMTCYGFENQWTDYIPSGGACFEKKRKDGGQFGHLFEVVHGQRTLPRISGEAGIEAENDLYYSNFTTDLHKMKVFPRVFVNGILKYNYLVEIRSPLGEEDWKSLRGSQEEIELIDWELFGLLPDCTIQAIKEPNKIRIISKEPAVLQYRHKKLQKNLHNIMREYDCFRLIGRPFCPTDMIDLAKMAKPTDSWFSVDYSAATDNLSQKYSSGILKRVLRGLSQEDQKLAMYSFGKHELYYPPPQLMRPSIPGKGPVHLGTMENGNLMGGILSFLVLCLSNLGLYLRVTDHSQMTWSDKERLGHVLVNGDDMVYAADPILWDVHVKMGELVGLKMSIGKSYVHPVYLNLNSTSVHFDLRKIYKEYDSDAFNDMNCDSWDKKGYTLRGISKPSIPRRVRSTHTPYQVNYLNSGLFYGNHKVQGESGHENQEEKKVDLLCQDYSNFRDVISRQGWDHLQSLGSRAASHDLMKILKGEKLFWKSKSLQPETLLRKLRELGVDENYENLVTSLNTVMKGSLPGKQKELLSKYIEVNKDNLKKETLGLYSKNGELSIFTRNLFLPIALGGLGIEKPNGFKTQIKPVQRDIARSCLYLLSEKRSIKLSSQRPCPGYDIETIDSMRTAPWVRKVPDVTIFEKSSSDETYPCNKDYLISFQGLRYGDNPSTYLLN